MIDLSQVRVEKLSKLHNTGSFDCGDEDINDFLKKDALMWQEKKLATTRIFIYNEEIIGFFCCSGDCIKLKTEEKEEDHLHTKPIKEIPAMKIGRLGRNKKYKKQDIGKNILMWAIGYIQSISENVGIRYVTVDAYPNKAEWHKKHGFKENQHKRYEDNRNVSMRYDLYNPTR